MKALTLICNIILSFTLSQVVVAQQVNYLKTGQNNGWKLIGTTEALFSTDHGFISVTNSFNNFKTVKFKVSGSPLRLVKIVVTYTNGAPDNIETLFSIPKGNESRTIEIRGAGQRKIIRIDFWYDPSGTSRGSAHVQMFGMK